MNSNDSTPRNAGPRRPRPAEDAGAKDEGKANKKGEANTAQSDAEAAQRSGQFGADRPDRAQAPTPRRGADEQPHPQGPEYEEGGRYPGTREPGGGR